MSNFNLLASLGWQSYFQQQLSLEEWEQSVPARIIGQQRSVLQLASAEGELTLPVTAAIQDVVVGDWLLLTLEQRFSRRLERKSCFARKAAGSSGERQLLAANIDTALLVSSMNQDFNLNRLERFLALINEAGAEPVIVLSKLDQTSQAQEYLQAVQTLDPFLPVLTLNCLDPESVQLLQPWVKPGATIALLGSSGVGKSSLVNTLSTEQRQDTAAIREDDAKGRHTTSSRYLLSLPNGGLILDTPGLREIQLVDSLNGIAATFADIEGLAAGCRFGNCEHAGEPGCAVAEAVASGTLEQRRLDNYRKLLREEALNSASLAQRRAADKALGKFYKRTQDQAKHLKGR